MPPLFKRRVVLNAGSAFLGITLPLSLAMWYTSDPGGDFRDRISPDSAAEAVVQRLPQVAVIGEKAGPAGTTEVFIQVPGVMNMQSVYVLSDGKTVISGFVLPDMERGGVPGGQLTMPDGKPSVNASAPRQDLEQLLTLIRDNREVRDQVMAFAEASEGGAGTAGSDRSEGGMELPSPVPAPAANEKSNTRTEPTVSGAAELPEPSSVASQDNAASESQEVAEESAPSVPEIPAVSQPAVPPVVASRDSDGASVPSPQPREAQEKTVDTEDGNTGDLTISDVAGAAAFGNHLKNMLINDAEIEAIRSITEPEEQQQAYLDYVKGRPAITQGSGPRHLYVLFDVNCPVCHKYYQQIKPKVDRGQLTVHWIPVVIFPDQRSSLTAGAQMLSLVEGGHQEQALQMLDNAMMSQGYAQVLDDHYSDEQHAHSLEGVIRGSATMAMAKPETPLIVFETEDGALSMRTGIPTPGYEMEVKVQQEVSTAH